jgi:arylsulfatase A-like enzyme
MRTRRSRGLRGWTSLSLAWVAIGLAAWLAPAAAQAQPNFVVIMTDDQRFDSLPYMPLTLDALASRGIQFTQAFTTTPVCAAARASFLAGGRRNWSTGVIENIEPNGGVFDFNDTNTLATRLQAAGYATALIGKYLNGYPSLSPYVPPGWTSWQVALNVALSPGGPFVVGSTGQSPGVASSIPYVTQYGTDYERDRALDFIEAHQDDPFFLFLSLAGPHTPSTPAPEDAGLFPDYLYRGRAYAEPDISDKPARIAILASQFPPKVAPADLLHRDMLRTLQSMDRAIDAVVDRLEQLDLMNDTYIIFLSDNGYLWGEHYLFGKGEMYEESMRVPLIVVAPGVAPRSDDRLVTSDLDVPAMIQELAGIPVQSDGTSLVPYLTDVATPIRTQAVVSMYQQWEVVSALRQRDGAGDFKYVEWSRNTPELYDLAADPFEESNLVNVPAYQSIKNTMAAQLAAGRGLAITTPFLPQAKVGQAYSAPIQRWGGVAPFTWSVTAGALPPGLTLNPNSGVISGAATAAGVYPVTIRVADSSTGLHSGQPQRYEQIYSNFTVVNSCGDGFDNDADGLVDLADPGCSSLSDPSEKDATLPCDDGVDNDGDTLVDLADSGCSGPGDPSEGTFACDDGLDNDGDTLVDLTDPGCSGPTDDSESGTAACDDDADNDGDGKVDTSDPGCAGPDDASELGTHACDDGADNDGDGSADMADPGCVRPTWNVENPQCDDDVDNDGDGSVDFADPQCTATRVQSEAPLPACGFGAELALAMAMLARWRRRREPHSCAAGVSVSRRASGPSPTRRAA